MLFRHPEWLGLGVLLILVLAILEARLQRRRRREWSALGMSRRLPKSGGLAWIIALGFLGVALAGPLGSRRPGTPAASGPDVVLLVDVSRSMAAEDAIPNRMGAAIRAAERIVEGIGRRGSGRVGVVAFAGRGVPRCPLTENLGAAQDVLRSLQPDAIEPGGSDLGAAFLAALDLFNSESSSGGRVIVALSDGEDHGGSWRAAIEEAARAGVVIDTVAIGDAEQGHPIPIQTAAGTRSELTFEGAPVRTRRDDSALLEAARMTGGVFITLGLTPPENLPELDEPSLVDRPLKDTSEGRKLADRDERFGWFVGAAILVGLVGSWPGRGPRALVLIVTGAFFTSPGWSGQEALRPAAPTTELDRWLNVIAEHPDGAVPNFNAASALFQLGRYERALTRYAAARARADAPLRAKIDFALGNTAFALGDRAGALRHYDDCLASKVTGAEADALRRDAAINRKFVENQGSQSQRADERDTGDSPTSPTPKPDAKRPDAPQKPRSTPVPPETRGPTPEEAPSKSSVSPRDELRKAVNQARDARRFRLSDESSPAPREPKRRDW